MERSESTMSDFVKEYQDMFDSFVQTRDLDLDDEYWSDKDKADFQEMYQDLSKKYNRESE
jgi:hypothetical protein